MYVCMYTFDLFKHYVISVVSRSAGTVLFKTNLLEVLEDHLFVLHLEPLSDDDVKQVPVTMNSFISAYVHNRPS